MPAEDTTYTAQWTPFTYTVTWVDETGTVLENDENVPYVTTPEFNGELPTKQNTAQYTYTFSWTPEVTAVTENVTYTAQFSETVNSYTVTFNSAGGSDVASQTVSYGETATAPIAPTRAGYTFGGWQLDGADYDFTAQVKSNVALTAVWTMVATPIRYPDTAPAADDGTSNADNAGTTEITDERTPLSDLPNVFADVADNAWYRDAVAYVFANGIMNGVGGDSFNPNGESSGAMAAAILYRFTTGETTSGADWAEAPLAWAEENGITAGIDFDANGNASREQVVTMLYRTAILLGFDVSAEDALDDYPDAASLSDYAEKAMKWAVASGIINGMDGKLNGDSSITRAQIATIILRFDELMSDLV